MMGSITHQWISAQITGIVSFCKCNWCTDSIYKIMCHVQGWLGLTVASVSNIQYDTIKFSTFLDFFVFKLLVLFHLLAQKKNK